MSAIVDIYTGAVGNEYKPLSASCSPKMLSKMRNSSGIRTEESTEDLYFGQLK